jgi:transcriptional regulator with XRE-family HTH domain
VPTFEQQREALGSFIRSQRELANLSLRQMAALADISNPYLSQIERGLHEPSVHVLRSIAQALNLSAETLLEHAGLIKSESNGAADVAAMIRSDTKLTDQQKQALRAVYRSYVTANGGAPTSQPEAEAEAEA